MPAIEKFNNVADILKSLELVGVGQLRKWRKDEIGWISSTDYYEFGEPDAYGMKDNVAIYLQSKDESYIEDVRLNMNQRNKNHIEESYQFYLKKVDLVFRALELNVPEGINDRIKQKENFIYETDRYIIETNITPDPRTDYYRLIIKTK
ncbi:hypothetical protein GGR92_005278 [Spirosoma lacussanchae]|uniref:hypothetical protein n=1 Tax=Spirosoma lacussanchae TaxID=1884249 RepID=UPI001109A18D|nr:hypothetical protein [Spirosoma lacussanchae]